MSSGFACGTLALPNAIFGQICHIWRTNIEGRKYSTNANAGKMKLLITCEVIISNVPTRYYVIPFTLKHEFSTVKFIASVTVFSSELPQF